MIFSFNKLTFLFSLSLSIYGVIIKGVKLQKVKLPGLLSNSFAHPLDISIRKQLSSLPLIEPLTRNTIEYVEEGLVIDNLSKGILVGPKQMPELYELLKSACLILVNY